MNCTYFINQSVDFNNTRLVNEVCAQYDFSDVSRLKAFINGTWYGGYYRESLMNATTMNETQLDTLYAINGTSTSFGCKLAEVLSSIAQRFECKNTANCSARELAYKQWGSSEVTRSP